MSIVKGIGVSAGNAAGILYADRREQKSGIEKLLSWEDERMKFDAAYLRLKEQLMNLSNRSYQKFGLVASSIVDGYRSMLEDVYYAQDIRTYITKQKMSAIDAVKTATLDRTLLFQEYKDQDINSRMQDIRDIGEQLCFYMQGAPLPCIPQASPIIYLAYKLDIISLFSLPACVKGIILRKGTKDSHLAILAACMELPMIIQIPEQIGLWESRTVIMNGDSGEVKLKDTDLCDKTGH